jgi:hypothetical protein
MNVDQLFLDTLSDLEGRLHTTEQSPSDYQVVKASALLRQLLVDQQNLVDQVNRTRRLKIRYRASDRKPPADPAPTFWTVQDGFDPETALRRSPILEVNRDGLLKCVVATLQASAGESKSVTVYDLIQYLAHVEGGVHAGQPKTPMENELRVWNQFVSIGGRPSMVRSLFAVGRVVVKGLEPLRAAIMRDASSSPA